MGDEHRTLRDRMREASDAMDRRTPEPADSPASMVGQVYNDGLGVPTSVPKFFAVRPVTVGGTEGVDLTPSLSVSSSDRTYFAVLGPQVPVAGDYLVADVVTGRWVAQHTGAVTPDAVFTFTNVTGCGCAVNGATLTLANATIGFSATRTSDASGNFTSINAPCIYTSAYTWSISSPGYVTKTGTFTLSPFDLCVANFNVTSLFGALANDPLYWCFGGTPTPNCKGLVPSQIFVTFGSTTDDVFLFGSLAGTTVTLPNIGFTTFQHSVTATGSCLASAVNGLVRVNYPTNGTCVAPDSVGVLFSGSTIDPLVFNTISMPRTSGTGACPVAFSASGSTPSVGPCASRTGTCTVSE